MVRVKRSTVYTRVKLEGRRERDGPRKSEQREERLARRREARHARHCRRIRTELIINAEEHQRLPSRDTHAWIGSTVLYGPSVLRTQSELRDPVRLAHTTEVCMCVCVCLCTCECVCVRVVCADTLTRKGVGWKPMIVCGCQNICSYMF